MRRKLTLRNVTGDGNCFFRAVLEELQRILPDKLISCNITSHTDLRQYIVTQFHLVALNYKDFFPDDPGCPNIEQYIKKMGTNYEYAEGPIIEFTATLFNITILIIEQCTLDDIHQGKITHQFLLNASQEKNQDGLITLCHQTINNPHRNPVFEHYQIAVSFPFNSEIYEKLPYQTEPLSLRHRLAYVKKAGWSICNASNDISGTMIEVRKKENGDFVMNAYGDDDYVTWTEITLHTNGALIRTGLILPTVLILPNMLSAISIRDDSRDQLQGLAREIGWLGALMYYQYQKAKWCDDASALAAHRKNTVVHENNSNSRNGANFFGSDSPHKQLEVSQHNTCTCSTDGFTQ